MDQDEYFSVKARLKINVEVLAPDENLPTMEAFQQEIPPAFLIASQCHSLDSKTQNELNEVNNDPNSAIKTLLKAQDSKINLLLGYILSSFDKASQSYFTQRFGASSLVFTSDFDFKKEQLVRLKLFLDAPSTAIYCYGIINQSQLIDDQYQISVSYKLLQDEDRDVLIRAALNYQQKLLRQRADARNL